MMLLPTLLLHSGSRVEQMTSTDSKKSTTAEGVRPPPEVTLDGVPPIPSALQSQLRPYQSSRSASLLDWHPSSRSILIATRFSEHPQLHLVKAPGGDRKQLCAVGNVCAAD